MAGITTEAELHARIAASYYQSKFSEFKEDLEAVYNLGAALPADQIEIFDLAIEAKMNLISTNIRNVSDEYQRTSVLLV